MVVATTPAYQLITQVLCPAMACMQAIGRYFKAPSDPPQNTRCCVQQLNPALLQPCDLRIPAGPSPFGRKPGISVAQQGFEARLLWLGNRQHHLAHRTAAPRLLPPSACAAAPDGPTADVHHAAGLSRGSGQPGQLARPVYTHPRLQRTGLGAGAAAASRAGGAAVQRERARMRAPAASCMRVAGRPGRRGGHAGGRLLLKRGAGADAA